MKKFIVFALIISTVTAACNFSRGNPPADGSPTSTATVLPSDTATIGPPTLTPLPTPTPPAVLGTIAMDFIALVCDAQWMNGGQHLVPCPDANADHSGGYAVPLDPTSEGLPADTPVLLTIPATNGYAALFLRYPPVTIQTGDRFRATLRCQSKAHCDVEYALEYFDARGKYSGPFLSWNYKEGDPEISVDEDLSALAGQTVELVLTLRPQNDTPQLDQSLWIAPYIYRPNP
jgi:hypothetical protein